jgi:potassium efflux system protein
MTNPRMHFHSLRSILAIALLLFVCNEAFAQTQTAPAPGNAAAIAAALKSLPAQRGLDDAQRKQAEQLLRDAQSDETEADQVARQFQVTAQLADGAEDGAQKIEETLAHPDADAERIWKAALPRHGTVEQLESLLARERAALADARSAAAAIDAEIHRQAARGAQLREELDAAHALLDNTPATDTAAPQPLLNAQRLRAKASERLATAKIALLDLENRTFEPRMRLLAAQSRERQHAVDELAQHVAVLESLALTRTGSDAGELCARIAQERDALAADVRSRLLGEAADSNRALCDQLTHAIQRIGELHAQQQKLDAAREDTARALANTEERVRIGGVSEAVGLILLAEQRKLKPLTQLRRELTATQTELAKTRMDLIDLREQQNTLGDIAGAVDQTLATAASASGEVQDKLRAGLTRLFATRAELLPRLSVQETRLASLLAETEQQLAELTSTTTRLGGVLDERLLWTPSHEPVDLAWLARIPVDTFAFFTSQRWTRAALGAARTAAAYWPLTGAALAVLGVLLSVRRRVPARLEHIAAPLRRIRTDRYRLTGKALAWTLLASLPAGLICWLLAKLMQQVAASGSGFAEALARAFALLILPAAALAFLRVLTIENGVAHFHFRWPRPRRAALHRAAPLLAILVLPTSFLLVLLTRPGSDAPLDTLGRALLALALGGAAWLFWNLLAPGRVWTARNIVLVEPIRLRQIIRFAFSTMCIGLIALDLAGYFVTAEALAARMVASLIVTLGIATLYGLGARWLVLGERRLALKRMLEKQASERQANETNTDGSESGEALPELPETQEITIASVSTQTRRLLRALTVLVTTMLLLWIWSDVTPALGLLGNFALWDSSQVVDGKEIALHVSVRDALEAFVVLALTWVATRNLPGLLEVGLLRRLQVDAPTRYAITSITRYVIVFAGTIFGLSMLGLRWSNLQWLAAGFSVGLGFGMQEIFANFISGLIVLFERPFRIGDVISIGGVEGTVARIRTRATTIVDWDNKEVVVPNRSFITERLVNWTLSDSTTRVVIKLGIAYRNDPKLAQKLLLEIAAAHPQVLAEPAPTCWMMGFGESTLDFELRVYVADIGQRNPVKTELQFRIAEVFAEHGIELAFRQMDLWVRNAVELKPPPADGPAGRTPTRSG